MTDSPIEITCPGCEERFQVPSEEQGRIAECPRCQGWIDVPMVEQLTIDDPIAIEGLPIVVDELILRPLEYHDCADLFEIYSHPAIASFEIEGTWTAKDNEEEVTWKLKNHARAPDVSYFLVAEHHSDGRAIGKCDLTSLDASSRQSHMAVSFNPEYGGRGLEAKMISAVFRFGFSHVRLHRIVAYVDVRHERVWRVLEQVGMQREGRMRENLFWNNEWRDDYLYAILEDEWHTRAGDEPEGA